MSELVRVRKRPRRFAGIGVRAQLSLVVLIAILPLLGLMLIGAGRSRQLVVDTAAAHLRDLARLGAARQDEAFHAARIVLTTLRSLPGAALADGEACHATLAAIARQYPQFGALGLVDADGLVDCASGPSAAPRAFPDPALLGAVRAAGPGALLVGDAMIDPATGRPIVVAAASMIAPTPNARGPRLVYLDIDLIRAAGGVPDAGFGAVASLALIDSRAGRVLWRAGDGGDRPAGSLAGAPLLDAIRIQPDGGAETANLDGAAGIFGFAPLVEGPPGRLMVAVGLPRAGVLAAADRRLAIALALALATAALAAAAAWLFADRTQVRAIRALVAAAHRLGAGDLEAKAAAPGWQASEFRLLSAALGEMACAIAGAQLRLGASERQLRLLADNATDMILLVEPGGRRIYASPACRTLLGYEPEEMLAVSAAEAVHPDDPNFLDDPHAPAGEEPTTALCRMRRKDGRYVWVESISRVIRQEDGKPARLIVVRDVDERIAAETRLKESESRYRYLTEHGADAVIQFDVNFAREYVSPACRDLLGYAPEELVAIRSLGTVHPDDVGHVVETFQSVVSGRVERAVAVNRMRRADGAWIWIEGHLRTLRDPRSGAPTGVIASMRDITVRKEAEEKLAEANRRLALLAGQDGLTGLANRRTFDDALRREHERAMATGSPLAMIMLDVDRFKAFNDRYGHPAGDDCLQRVARAIESAVPWLGDLVARYGGEEFAALLPDTDEAGAVVVADRIRRAVLGLAIEHDAGLARVVTISAGVAALAGDGSLQALVRQADRALYSAKRQGRNTVARATPDPVEKSDAA